MFCVSLWLCDLLSNITVTSHFIQSLWSLILPISTYCNPNSLVPECRPIWSHPSSPLLVHRSEQAACTQDVLSPTGFHASANHLPPPPIMGWSRAKIKSFNIILHVAGSREKKVIEQDTKTLLFLTSLYPFINFWMNKMQLFYKLSLLHCPLAAEIKCVGSSTSVRKHWA